MLVVVVELYGKQCSVHAQYEPEIRRKQLAGQPEDGFYREPIADSGVRGHDQYRTISKLDRYRNARCLYVAGLCAR